MNGEDSSNEISTTGKTTSHRKRKRRKWKKSVSSNLVDSESAFGDDSCYNCGVVPTWYWSNYFRALEWQNKHKVALWKSYALGLQQENRSLVMELQKQFPGRIISAPLTLQNSGITNKIPRGRYNETNDVEDDAEMDESSSRNGELEFEMSEEMMNFFEQSIKHKLEMRKLKEEVHDCIDEEVKELQEAHHQREKEMMLLYGDGSSMIIGMETAIQLSFDKYCDLKSPKYWPNIPLNI